MRSILILITATLLMTKASAQLMEDLSLKYQVHLPAEQTNHARLVILLHGYGSNEDDLFGLRSYFPKNCLIISARGPMPAGQGYAWYDLNSKDQQAQVSTSRDQVLKFITEVTRKYSVDPKEIYVMGFSQGAMMSYEIGLTHPELVKGIGVLSGRLFPWLKQESKNNANLKNLRIFIAHGTADERIKFNEGQAAADYLKSVGLNPGFHEYKGMTHTINNDVVRDLMLWLR